MIARTRAYYRLIARAGWFVNNVGFPEDVVKRPGTVRIHTHHGTPIKTMGLDQLGSFVGGRVDREGQLRRVARWDYSVSQSPFATRTWERAYPGAYRTLEVGHPRNDRLATSTTDDVARIRDQLGIAPGVRTVLYAPTHREYLPKLDAYLDPDRFAAALGPEYLVLHRLHFLVRGRRPEAGGATLDVTEYGSVEDLYLAADVLVTDYSSVLFDFAVLDRPIAVYAPDWEVYSALRGVYFDLPAQPPGIVATTQESLVEAFRSGAVDGEEAARLRSTFRATFCPHDDGRAAERVVREVWTPRVVPGASEGRTALVTMGAGVRRA